MNQVISQGSFQSYDPEIGFLLLRRFSHCQGNENCLQERSPQGSLCRQKPARESCVSGHTSLCSSWGFTLVNDSESPNMKRPLTDFHQRTQLNSYERIKNQSQPPETACESNTTQLSNNNQRTGNSFMGSWANKENTKQL